MVLRIHKPKENTRYCYGLGNSFSNFINLYKQFSNNISVQVIIDIPIQYI